MDGRFVQQALANNPVTSPYFVPQIFLLDDLINFNNVSVPCAIVINVITRNEVKRKVLGHYIAVFVTKSSVFFLDTFARPVSSFPSQLGNFIQLICKGRQLVTIKQPIQSKSSCCCAFFIIYLLFCLCQKESLDSILNSLQFTNLNYNDFVVLHFFSYVFHFNFSSNLLKNLINC